MNAPLDLCASTRAGALHPYAIRPDREGVDTDRPVIGR